MKKLLVWLQDNSELAGVFAITVATLLPVDGHRTLYNVILFGFIAFKARQNRNLLEEILLNQQVAKARKNEKSN